MNKNLLPVDMIDQWPEVLCDIDARIVPMSYLQELQIGFVEGKTWTIDVSKLAKANKVDVIEGQIEEIIDTYCEKISHIDMKLDISRIKKDAAKCSKKFFKTNKRGSK